MRLINQNAMIVLEENIVKRVKLFNLNSKEKIMASGMVLVTNVIVRYIDALSL